DPLRSLLARARVLRDAADLLPTLVPRPPEPGDIAGWLSLAEDLATLREKLAAERVEMKDVPERCASMPDFPDDARWIALAAIEEAYDEALAADGRVDLHRAREQALVDGACTYDGE